MNMNMRSLHGRPSVWLGSMFPVVGVVVGGGMVWGVWKWWRARVKPKDLVVQVSVPIEQSTVEFCEVVTETRCTNAGVMYGGELLSSMDLAAGSCVYKHCLQDGAGAGVVTVSIDAVQFLAPAKPFELLRLRARLNAVFNTSMEVEVKVQAENPMDGTIRDCGVGRLVFVRLSRRPVPRLLLQTDEDRRRETEAKVRQKNYREEGHAIASATDEQWLEKFEEAWKSISKDDKNGIPMEETRLEVTKIVMPQHTNPLGITFGGQVLAWMELAACMSAARLARTPVVTVGLDRMRFRESSRVGSLLVFQSQVNRVFNKSIEVGVRVVMFQGSQRDIHCNTGYFTFTSLDPQSGLPIYISRHVKPTCAEDKKRFYLSGKRRLLRLQQRRGSFGN